MGYSEIYKELKEWRLQQAEYEDLPAYCIFNNETLEEIASMMPRSRSALSAITGIGSVRLDKYGDEILDIVRRNSSSGRSRSSSSRSQYRSSSAPNAGEPWTEEEARNVYHYHKKGYSIDRIAKYHGRTENAIRAKLRSKGVDI